MAETKYVVTIHPEAETSDIYVNDNWKGYVFSEDKFDETFLITGNNNFKGTPKEDYPSWYSKTKEVINELTYDDDYEDILNNQPNALTGEKNEDFLELAKYYKDNYQIEEKTLLNVCAELKRLIDERVYPDSIELEMFIANLMYPDKSISSVTISGNVQSEWQEVVYDASEIENVDETIEILSDFYWGNISEIHIQEVPSELKPEEYEDFDCFKEGMEDYWDYVSNSELYKWEKENSLVKNFRERYGLPEDCRIEVRECHTERVYSYKYTYEDKVAEDPEEDIER